MVRIASPHPSDVSAAPPARVRLARAPARAARRFASSPQRSPQTTDMDARGDAEPALREATHAHGGVLLFDGLESDVFGSGLFHGLRFHALVRGLGSTAPHHTHDFTQGMTQSTPFSAEGSHGIGRYNERRRNMYNTELFADKGEGAAAAWADTAKGERRDIHMGIDVGGPVGTPLHAVEDGVVHSVGYNAADGDYGNVIVLEHELAGRRMWALHGHLSAASIVGKQPGDVVGGGDVVGWIGSESENGGWPPHVHYQISLVEPKSHDMPGVVADSQHEEALRDYPDPRMVLGPLYPGTGLFE